MHASRIIGHGFVPDVRPTWSAARSWWGRSVSAVVPRLKVLEAMNMGKAMVCTTVGVEGIAVKDGRDAGGGFVAV